jgi:hypothetical protein
MAVFGLLARFVRLIAARVLLLALSGDRRDAEILALRHQVLVCDARSNVRVSLIRLCW